MATARRGAYRRGMLTGAQGNGARRAAGVLVLGLVLGSAAACADSPATSSSSVATVGHSDVVHHRHQREQPPVHLRPTTTPTATPSPTPAPVRTATSLVAGHSAWVSVAVARLWESPASPRTVDAPALTAPVQFRQWLSAMTLTERRALSSYSDTEALMGERVVVRQVTGTWAEVVVPDQPSQKAPGGYPGWLPVRQLAAGPPPRTALVATVVSPTAWLRRDDASLAPVVEISSGTSLPVLAEDAHGVVVRTPSGARRELATDGVVVHRRGTAALPPHVGVVSTARQYLGTAYLWGGLSGFGLDCSGLTWLSNRLHGTQIPRDALPQSQHGRRVSRSGLAPGDLIFYATDGLVHHVTMYVGSGEMIEAPQTGDVTKIDAVRSVEYYGARRY